MLSLLPLLVHGLRAPLPQRVASRSAVPMMQDALEQASASADAFYSMLGDLQPPASLASLKDAIASGDLKKVRVAQYNLLIDQTLLYDVEGEGEGATLVPTAAKMEQDDPLTKEKMRYAYSYGIKMFMADMIEQEALQAVVMEKLAGKVGLDGAGLDQWLDMPAVV
ncbi:hypothetical protein EMIHUDRAFT_451891 [Emiliania huxleyi CCMP1516]|uniref:Uncharacterized protein n=2 Tax=Emiliania huxleyi TaxID=2903 RepID=A0A0D3IR79_EMIH1|nr:hypothetical protein EMIHUDRAFT_451891 [Emiliania huxleyi CCMP1516]EOD13764.1 hypothetical protein EMIHUDRAFT_451891 [Emiliania huxleyi CCMP1516]|eukprot:XP_005766193.1 hypothetical protein EMIHUDRAFT_451891 [Emiliania huxleyi CCMP1516]